MSERLNIVRRPPRRRRIDTPRWSPRRIDPGARGRAQVKHRQPRRSPRRHRPEDTILVRCAHQPCPAWIDPVNAPSGLCLRHEAESSG